MKRNIELSLSLAVVAIAMGLAMLLTACSNRHSKTEIAQDENPQTLLHRLRHSNLPIEEFTFTDKTFDVAIFIVENRRYTIAKTIRGGIVILHIEDVKTE